MAKPKKGSSRGSRKSKAEASTGAKENGAEMRSPELEGLVLQDDDFDLHFASVKRAVDAQKKAKTGYDACCKAAKKVSPELLEAVKFAIRLEGMDAADVKRELEVRGYALKRTGSPVQLTIHDTLLGDVLEVAYKRGFEAGEKGQTLTNPYPAGSDLEEQYATGWRNGQAKLLQINLDDPVPGTNGAGTEAHANA